MYDYNKYKTFRIGAIRPPSEANSLLLQITEGCTWNKCKFCKIYSSTPFKMFSIESVKEDIDAMRAFAEIGYRHKDRDGNWHLESINRELNSIHDEKIANCAYLVVNWLINGQGSVFLQDGNSLAMKPSRLIEILSYLREVFPNIRRVTTYARGESLAKLSPRDYSQLKASGLSRIHSGYESGSQEVLDLINKNATVEQYISGGQSVREGGVELSVYFMPGIGGKALSKQNGEGMAAVINSVNPEFLRVRSAVIKRNSDLWPLVESGEFILASEEDKINEIKAVIEGATGISTEIVSDHMVNLLPEIQGSLKFETNKMLSVIARYFGLTEDQRELFSLMRRRLVDVNMEGLKAFNYNEKSKYIELLQKIKEEGRLDLYLNDVMSRYI